MNGMRSGYFTAFSICLPLLIWVWGTIANADLQVDIVMLLRQALDILICLQCATLIMTVSYYSHPKSLSVALLSVYPLIFIPLPFLAIASMAGVISIMAIIKLIMMQLLLVALIYLVTLLCRPWQGNIKLDLLFGVVLTVFIWNTQAQWQAWLI